MGFYAYLWLRDDGTPYYAGKGSGDRAFVHYERSAIHPPKDKSLIVVMHRSSEQEAFATEIELIRNWGRLDLGTGCLRNLTDGGIGGTAGQKPAHVIKGWTNSGSFKAGHAGIRNRGNFVKGIKAWNKGTKMPSVSAKMKGNLNWKKADKKKAAFTRFLKTIAWG
jgi:hypothetical protein